MDKKGVGGMFGTIACPTTERQWLDTGLSAFAGTTANRKDSNFPAVVKPI
jgi:hypothetical protein